MFYKCRNCGHIQSIEELEENYHICLECGFYESLTYQQRLALIVDQGSFVETNAGYGFHDPITFPGYLDKHKTACEKTGMQEAVVTGKGRINGNEAMIAVMDSRFMMSSMGIVTGEKITRLYEQAEIEELPVIIFSASGGARMQEGILALMQMAKTASSAASFQKNGGLYISILTNPTAGGVSASFSFLGDIIMAEPGAVICFAGRRVIEQTIHEKLPEDFQTAEYLLEHGFIDRIIERKNMKQQLGSLLQFHKR